MKFDIRKRNLRWSDALARHAETRLRGGLDRIGGRIRRVLVRLVDVNGPRGGPDKRCAVSVHLASGQEIVVRADHDCPYRAIDDAAGRLKRTVTERIRRTRMGRNWHPLCDRQSGHGRTGVLMRPSVSIGRQPHRHTARGWVSSRSNSG